MSVLNTDSSIFFIVDIQEKLLNAAYNKNIIERNAAVMAKAVSILNIPIIITEQYPKGLGETVSNIKSNLNDAHFFEKVDFNALNDKNIANLIQSTGRNQIILAGIETHICVQQTAEALINQGIEVSVLKDLCSSRKEEEHLAGLDLMKQNGAFIKTTETALFELLKSAKHPNFKEVQALIK